MVNTVLCPVIMGNSVSQADTIYEVGIKDDKPYFLMKYLKGQTLSEKLKDASIPQFRQEPKYWLRIFLDVCDALAFAHSKGILHLDIKADNI